MPVTDPVPEIRRGARSTSATQTTNTSMRACVVLGDRGDRAIELAILMSTSRSGVLQLQNHERITQRVHLRLARRMSRVWDMDGGGLIVHVEDADGTRLTIDLPPVSVLFLRFQVRPG